MALAVAVSGVLPATAQESGAGGRIAGQVIDQSTGRPIPQAQVQVVGARSQVIADVNGRFRSNLLPIGVHVIEVSTIGYATVRMDSLRVAAGEVVMVTVPMQPSAVALDAVVVEATGRRASSQAGLLARQKAAAVVMDGTSAEQIARSPDADAGDAIARVTGVSVVDNKFVVVRGLAERYSNTLLNGSELPSPEPTKRIVPLDIFPASLLQSIVTKKTATPDMPGDFAGGSVELQTKDFPESRVLEFSISQGYNSEVTFDRVAFLRPVGWRDWFGFDGAGRNIRPSDFDSGEALLEAQRNVWTPAERVVRPNLGASLTYGNQFGEFERSLGVALSLDYGYATSRERDDYFAFVEGGDGTDLGIESRTQHATTTANVGALANIATRLGSAHTIALKNMMTHEAEDFAAEQDALDTDVQSGFDNVLRRYQVRYIERRFLQSQLTGDHYFQSLLGSRLRWSASYAYAGRDEPENRTLTYARNLDSNLLQMTPSETSFFWFRFLDDRIYTGSLDVTSTLPWVDGRDLLLKVGGSTRQKAREFEAEVFNLQPLFGPKPDGDESLQLPPEQMLAPENVGRNVTVQNLPTVALPYDSHESVRAAYGMIDVSLLPSLRIVGGLRAEQWQMDVENMTVGDSVSVIRRDELDLLWSANLTLALSESMNMRAAAYRTVSRPDPREIAAGSYVAVAGRCNSRGNPDLNRATILNGDLRWEWYPAPGELISLSGFYKLFNDPVIEIVAGQQGGCQISPLNAEEAVNLGGEVELRKTLGFLAASLENVGATLNFTFVNGHIDFDAGGDAGIVRRDLQDQSRYLLNTGLSYNGTDNGLSATVLYNYFSDRARRYGFYSVGLGIAPDVIERGRSTIDARLSKRFGRLTASLSGRNLTNAQMEEVQITSEAVPVGRSKSGMSLSLGLKYAF